MATHDALDIAELGRRLAARREELRLDQEAVADRAKLSRAYISRLERGIVPNPKVVDLAQVAQALQFPLSALLDTDAAATESRVAECTALLKDLAGEPPAVVETVLRWWRDSVQIAKLHQQ